MLRRSSKHVLPVSLLLILSAASCARKDTLENAAYRKPNLPVEQRVSDLLRRMTAEEKANLLEGANWMESRPIERL